MKTSNRDHYTGIELYVQVPEEEDMKQEEIELAIDIGLSHGIRYTPGTGFVTWTGTRWQHDQEDGLTTAWLIGQALLSLKMPASLHNITTLRRCCQIAAPLQVPAEEWDANPDLFGWANGIWNLRTMENLGFDPNLKVTRYSPYQPEEGRISQYLAHVLELCGDDDSLAGLLRDRAGYWLTGHTSLQELVVLESEGGRGKSTWARIIAGVMGQEYAGPAPAGLITREEGYLNRDYAVAGIIGKRLLYQDEMERGTQLNEAVLKALTGEGTLKGRAAYAREHIEVKPGARCLLLTNHPVRFTGLGRDMQRRLTYVKPHYSGDPGLPDLGRTERILREEGNALAYHLTLQAHIWLKSTPEARQRLPKAVLEARDGLFYDNDTARQWLEERTEEGDKMASAEALQSFRWWCDAAGLKPFGAVEFKRAMERLGLHYQIIEGRRFFRGRKLVGD